MKIIKYLAAAALTLLAVSCNKEQVAEVPDGQMVDVDKTATFTDLKTQVTLSLVKGKTYNFVFWAQADEGAPYDVTDLKNIKISYEGAEANDEKRDAFYATR